MPLKGLYICQSLSKIQLQNFKKWKGKRCFSLRIKVFLLSNSNTNNFYKKNEKISCTFIVYKVKIISFFSLVEKFWRTKKFEYIRLWQRVICWFKTFGYTPTPLRKHDHGKAVFLGNLSYTTHEDDMHAAFKKYGKIEAWIYLENIISIRNKKKIYLNFTH